MLYANKVGLKNKVGDIPQEESAILRDFSKAKLQFPEVLLVFCRKLAR